MPKTSWRGHSFWNTAEHGLSRVLDAAATIFVLRYVPTVQFSELALAQAFAAPALFVFLSPETVLYRDYGKWKALGAPELQARIRALRKFAWLKLPVALAVALGVAALLPANEAQAFPFPDRFYAALWAILLPLVQQIAGADREYLRLDLRLRALNLISFLQRFFYLLFLYLAFRFFGFSYASLAGSVLFSAVLSAAFARWSVESRFEAVPDARLEWAPFIRSAVAGFSIWNHVSGILLGWVQTLDLFFLGVFRAGAATIGLYGVVLKVANIASAVPIALANLYLVRLGRESGSADERPRELAQLKTLTAKLAVAAFGIAAVVRLAAPLLIAFLSKGRWTEEEQSRLLVWLNWILPASALYASTLLATGWLSVRTSYRDLFLRAYLPWAALSAAIYAAGVAAYGADGVARLNLLVVAILPPFLVILYARLRSARAV